MRLPGFLPRLTLRWGTVWSRAGEWQKVLDSSDNAEVIYWRTFTKSMGSQQTANIVMSPAWEGEDRESKLVVMTELGDSAYFLSSVICFWLFRLLPWNICTRPSVVYLRRGKLCCSPGPVPWVLLISPPFLHPADPRRGQADGGFNLINCFGDTRLLE